MNKLKSIEELKQSHTNNDMVQALKEYALIVEDVAKNYTNDTAPQKLRLEHPELDFMDDELEEVLRAARKIRFKMDMEKEIEKRKKLDKIRDLFSEGRDKDAVELLKEYNNQIIDKTEKEIDELIKENNNSKKHARGKSRNRM